MSWITHDRNRGNADINYLVLLLVIVAGVAIGNLISNWVTAKVVAYETEQALAKLSTSAAAGAARARDAAITQAQKAATAIASQQEQIREQRRLDREGRRLSQACDEWRKAHAQLNSYTTNAEMTKHCTIYERYVQGGVLPPKK